MRNLGMHTHTHTPPQLRWNKATDDIPTIQWFMKPHFSCPFCRFVCPLLVWIRTCGRIIYGWQNNLSILIRHTVLSTPISLSTVSKHRAKLLPYASLVTVTVTVTVNGQCENPIYVSGHRALGVEWRFLRLTFIRILLATNLNITTARAIFNSV